MLLSVETMCICTHAARLLTISNALRSNEQLTRMNAIVVQKEKQEAAARRGGDDHGDDSHGH